MGHLLRYLLSVSVETRDFVSEVAPVEVLESVSVGWRIHSLGLLRRPTGLRVGHASCMVSLGGGVCSVEFGYSGLLCSVMVGLVK